MLHRVLVPIHSSNVGREIVPSWCRNLGPVTCLQNGHPGKHHLLRLQKQQPPLKEPRDICALATQRTFLTQEEMVLAQTGQCCLLLPKKTEVTQDPSGFILKDSVHLK